MAVKTRSSSAPPVGGKRLGLRSCPLWPGPRRHPPGKTSDALRATPALIAPPARRAAGGVAAVPGAHARRLRGHARHHRRPRRADGGAHAAPGRIVPRLRAPAGAPRCEGPDASATPALSPPSPRSAGQLRPERHPNPLSTVWRGSCGACSTNAFPPSALFRGPPPQAGLRQLVRRQKEFAKAARPGPARPARATSAIRAGARRAHRPGRLPAKRRREGHAGPPFFGGGRRARIVRRASGGRIPCPCSPWVQSQRRPRRGPRANSARPPPP